MEPHLLFRKSSTEMESGTGAALARLAVAQVHPIRFTNGNYSKRAAVALPGSIHRHPPFSVVAAVWPIPSAAVEPLRTEVQRSSVHPRRVESGRALGHHETTLMKRSFNSR